MAFLAVVEEEARQTSLVPRRCRSEVAIQGGCTRRAAAEVLLTEATRLSTVLEERFESEVPTTATGDMKEIRVNYSVIAGVWLLKATWRRGSVGKSEIFMSDRAELWTA